MAISKELAPYQAGAHSLGGNAALTAGNTNNLNNPYLGALFSGGLGAVGAGLGSLFAGYNNPADSAMEYYNKIPGVLEKYNKPYIEAGQRQLPGLENEYGSLVGNPGGKLNSIGQNYQQSPGFQFALQQALQAGGNAAAAGGYAGTPQDQQIRMQTATGLANQDYQNYLQNALGLYGTGLGGQGHLYDVGAQTGVGMGQDLSSLLAQQGKLAYEGENAQNQHDQGMWGSLLGGAGTALGAFAMMSSREIKDKVSTPSTTDILNNVRNLSLDKWKYKGIDQEFIGPYAEEFKDRFGVGDGKTINMIDVVGVLMGAIKELDKKLSELKGLDHAHSIS